jgi:hypothetical protein
MIKASITIIAICVIAMMWNKVYDMQSMDHQSSLYESVEDECNDFEVTYCSEEMLVVLRTQR